MAVSEDLGPITGSVEQGLFHDILECKVASHVGEPSTHARTCYGEALGAGLWASHRLSGQSCNPKP